MGETQAPGGPEGSPGATWPRTLAVARVLSGAGQTCRVGADSGWWRAGAGDV